MKNRTVKQIIRTTWAKRRHFKKIMSIINSCRTITHIENCNVIVANFFRMHNDIDLHSELRRELKFKRLILS